MLFSFFKSPLSVNLEDITFCVYLSMSPISSMMFSYKKIIKMYSLNHVIGTAMSFDMATCPVQIVRDKLYLANVQSSAVQSSLNDLFIIQRREGRWSG